VSSNNDLAKWNSVDSETSVTDYQSKQTLLNNLEGQISLTEKNSKKLMPIYQEVLQKIIVIERGNN
jgi:hypothetical protein